MYRTQLTYRHLRADFSLFEPEDILQPEQLTLSLFVALHALKVPCLEACIVSHGHLLLFVDLTRIDQFFKRTSTQKAIDRNVTRLAISVSTVHRLEVMGGVYAKGQRQAMLGRILSNGLTPVGI